MEYSVRPIRRIQRLPAKRHVVTIDDIFKDEAEAVKNLMDGLTNIKIEVSQEQIIDSERITEDEDAGENKKCTMILNLPQVIEFSENHEKYDVLADFFESLGYKYTGNQGSVDNFGYEKMSKDRVVFRDIRKQAREFAKYTAQIYANRAHISTARNKKDF